MSFASLLSPILVLDSRNLRLQVADGHPKPLDGRTKAAYVHPKPANGDFTSASRRIYVGSFEVSSVLLWDVSWFRERGSGCRRGSGKTNRCHSLPIPVPIHYIYRKLRDAMP